MFKKVLLYLNFPVHSKLSTNINYLGKGYKNKMAYTAKDPRPALPTAFTVPKRNKKLEVGRRRRRREKVSLKTHTTARGMGKKNGTSPSG